VHEFSLSVYAYAGAVLRFESPAQNEECKGEEMMERASIFFSFFTLLNSSMRLIMLSG
jgi:hypothetical protein